MRLLEGQHQRLAADLHDSHLQSLAAIGLKLDQARLRLGAEPPEATRALLDELRDEVAAEGAALRRTIGALRPLVACTVTDGLAGERVDPGVETALFRVAQQALANVEQHAAARHVRVRLERSGPWVALAVDDDGCGFDPSHVEVLPGHQSFGLTSMRERVQAIGGRLTVDTGRVAAPTWRPGCRREPPHDPGHGCWSPTTTPASRAALVAVLDLIGLEVVGQATDGAEAVALPGELVRGPRAAPRAPRRTSAP
jgi:signal transduction histidine kinase